MPHPPQLWPWFRSTHRPFARRAGGAGDARVASVTAAVRRRGVCGAAIGRAALDDRRIQISGVGAKEQERRVVASATEQRQGADRGEGERTGSSEGTQLGR